MKVSDRLSVMTQGMKRPQHRITYDAALAMLDSGGTLYHHPVGGFCVGRRTDYGRDKYWVSGDCGYAPVRANSGAKLIKSGLLRRSDDGTDLPHKYVLK